MIKQKINQILMYIKGYKFVRLWLKENSHSVYLLNNSHIGDVCYGLAYLKSWMEYSGVSDITVIGCDYLNEVYNSFGISADRIKYVPVPIQHCVLLYLQKSPAGKNLVRNGRFIVTHTSYYMSSTQLEQSGLSVNDLMKQYVYRMDASVRAEKPIIKSQITEENLAKYKIVKDKTVIISPYANSIQISYDFFQKLADRLLELGWHVLTNISGKDQKPLQGTMEARLSLVDTYTLAQYCGVVIGARSGFMDFIVSSGARTIVLYNKEYPMRNAYRMTAWEYDAPVCEYVLSHDICNDDIDKILNIIEDNRQ